MEGARPVRFLPKPDMPPQARTGLGGHPFGVIRKFASHAPSGQSPCHDRPARWRPSSVRRGQGLDPEPSDFTGVCATMSRHRVGLPGMIQDVCYRGLEVVIPSDEELPCRPRPPLTADAERIPRRQQGLSPDGGARLGPHVKGRQRARVFCRERVDQSGLFGPYGYGKRPGEDPRPTLPQVGGQAGYSPALHIPPRSPPHGMGMPARRMCWSAIAFHLAYRVRSWAWR
jgi:hypothetical protein